MTEGIKVESILPGLGFAKQQNEVADWMLRSNGLELDVVVGINPFFAPALNFSGNYSNGRTMQLIEFSLSPDAASLEQGLALLSYYLQELPVSARPVWIDDGLALQAHLPWRRS